MSTSKHFDKICCVVLALTLILTVWFFYADRFGIQKTPSTMGYESRLFDTSRVHTIDIVMDDWDEFIDSCITEEYAVCTVLIDGEAYRNVAIRAKGNTSLTQVASYGNDRYSFKIEFDHYDSAKTYYGLDKLCLNNIIQDNTYVKDYLTYQMMAEIGVASPLCSYVNILVNGENWGLYLAVEGVEEAFLERNYGKDYGELYKPDSMNIGGGRGNGKDFEMDAWEDFEPDSGERPEGEWPDAPQGEWPGMQQEGQEPGMPPEGQKPGNLPEGQRPGMPSERQEIGSLPEGQEPGTFPNRGEQPGQEGPGGMGKTSDDVLLRYIDDDAQSYENIFDHAKTNVSDSDKERLIESLKKLNSREALTEVVDIESVIRYFVVHNFVLNFDSYTGSMIHNYYLYEKNGQMSMIPWDYNLAFGGFLSAKDAASLINYPIDSPVSGGNVEDRPMIAWIFAEEEYTERYHQYFSEWISSYFNSGEFAEKIDSVKALISPYVEADPTKFCTYEEFVTGIDTLKEFCLLRAESIKGQLDGTIGSTTETQSEATWIDAGDLNVSDMGGMNSGMGGMKSGMGGERNGKFGQKENSSQNMEAVP
ncbi:CotH kinase family protein [Hominifimenecus sp. rT4P-3]|uniref:CotH kinase family protein n=1 Tax=Hominifimenecus sp. rT4P-3 TaxID=3242979 RepID=UPI003DA2FDF5